MAPSTAGPGTTGSPARTRRRRTRRTTFSPTGRSSVDDDGDARDTTSIAVSPPSAGRQCSPTRPPPAPCGVDLRPGGPSEDTMSGLPDVTGGCGDDVLTGDDGPNRLMAAEASRSLATGAAGTTTWLGDSRRGTTRDLLTGGAGDDTRRFRLPRHSSCAAAPARTRSIPPRTHLVGCRLRDADFRRRPRGLHVESAAARRAFDRWSRRS